MPSSDEQINPLKQIVLLYESFYKTSAIFGHTVWVKKLQKWLAVFFFYDENDALAWPQCFQLLTVLVNLQILIKVKYVK